jgi:hypothetical protein
MSPACTGSVKRCAAELGVISACVLVLVLVVALDALAAVRAFVLVLAFEDVEPHHPALPADTRDPTFVDAVAPVLVLAPAELCVDAAFESRAPTALNCTGVFHRHHISSLRHATAPPRTSIPMQSPTCAILRTGVSSASGLAVGFVVVCFGCRFVFVCGFVFAPPLALEAFVVELDVVAPALILKAPSTSPAGT